MRRATQAATIAALVLVAAAMAGCGASAPPEVDPGDRGPGVAAAETPHGRVPEYPIFLTDLLRIEAGETVSPAVDATADVAATPVAGAVRTALASLGLWWAPGTMPIIR